MARNYKRDSKGRFARAGGRALARRSAKKKAASLYRGEKRYNKKMSKLAVKYGYVNKKNTKILRKNANAKAKAKYKASTQKRRR